MATQQTTQNTSAQMEVIVMFTVNSAYYVLFCLLCSCSLVSLPPFKTCISLPSAWWLCVSLWWWHFWESKSSAQATNIHFKSTDLYVLIKVDAILDVRDSHLAEWEATEKLPETDSFQAPGLESSLALENNQGIEGINQSPQAINLKLVEGHVISSSKG